MIKFKLSYYSLSSSVLLLKSIVNETMPDGELVENLVGKFIEANHSK